MNNRNNQKLIKPLKRGAAINNCDLYTALSIFVITAPRLIDGIFNAVETEDLSRVEELAALLSTHSGNAQLPGFTENVNSLIIAARERKVAVAKNQAQNLKNAFEQMTD